MATANVRRGAPPRKNLSRSRKRKKTSIPHKSGQDVAKSGPYRHTSVFIGENFSVIYSQWFKFSKLLTHVSDTGVIMTSFRPLRNLHDMTLSPYAIRLLTVPNAGGNSVVSEVLSFELLHKCFGASLLKTEMEVRYFPMGGSITDYVCDMSGVKVGVSVTRAMKYHGDYTREDAERLLRKKLAGIIQSSRNTLEKWTKQILHVWAASSHVANLVTKIFNRLDGETKSNTVVLVTVAANSGFIFANK